LLSTESTASAPASIRRRRRWRLRRRQRRSTRHSTDGTFGGVSNLTGVDVEASHTTDVERGRVLESAVDEGLLFAPRQGEHHGAFAAARLVFIVQQALVVLGHHLESAPAVGPEEVVEVRVTLGVMRPSAPFLVTLDFRRQRASRRTGTSFATPSACAPSPFTGWSRLSPRSAPPTAATASKISKLSCETSRSARVRVRADGKNAVAGLGERSWAGAHTFLSDGDRGRGRCDVGLRRRHPHLKGAFACPHRHARRGQRPWATVQRCPRV
jgi:hypothetical protein